MRYKFRNMFNNHKTLYLVFSVVLVSIFSLTIVYAALSTTLKITGNTEVVASSWDIYLDNVQLMNGSVTTNVPTITNKTTASFTTTLTNPGDYYMFTIDVVNNGSIDAMIDSIEKLPQLSETQAKYLNYIVEYQSGESINTKQLVEAKSFVRLKVKIEFRNDISPIDLPTQPETLNLSFKVNYVQSDDTGSSVINNGKEALKIVNGDYDTIGSEICIEEECFYVISSDDDSVTMLSKYNLHVGNSVADSTYIAVALEKPTGIQDSSAIGCQFDAEFKPVDFPWIGIKSYSSTNYWSSTVSSYPAYVYDENSYLYEYVENYKIYLEDFGVSVEESRLIKKEELESLGCDLNKTWCTDVPEWIYGISYWTGTAFDNSTVLIVYNDGEFVKRSYDLDSRFGVRPVITILKSEF